MWLRKMLQNYATRPTLLSAVLMATSVELWLCMVQFHTIGESAKRPVRAAALPLEERCSERKTIHVRDLAAEIDTEFPESKTRQQITGTRTMLATPLLREGLAIGGIVI